MEIAEVEANIRKNVSWDCLSNSVKQHLGNSKKEYDKAVIVFSIKNQVRFEGNIVQTIRKDKKKYYDELIEYSRKSLMLFPYHLSDIVVRILNTTPFHYYLGMLEFLMEQERSYDSLPNFTAADCLRLLGIGRNQYIDLMNSNRSSRKFGFFKKKSTLDNLPSKPVQNIVINPWWILQVGYVTEDDVKALKKEEHKAIDRLIDLGGGITAGSFDYNIVRQLYLNGLVYFDVPIEDTDYVVVPPLENFVMNRVLGDFFETLLYKIFVSIDENTSVEELASILELDSAHIRNAVSLYCRLGIAKKKNAELDSNDLHPSWYDHIETSSGIGLALAPAAPAAGPARTVSVSSEDEDDSLLRELNQELETADETDGGEDLPVDKRQSQQNQNQINGGNFLNFQSTTGNKKIGFLFDSSLTAYLMMGNLSPGLKTHAVTMFEVGKLSDESLDNLVAELEKVSNSEGEGEAARYFSHALTLRNTVLFLRQNPEMMLESNPTESLCLGLDLIRCESLQGLDPATARRLLSKNYSLLVSMAPLKNELRPSKGCFPPLLGPSVPEMSSVWFKMFIYKATCCGTPSLLLPKGSRLRRLPKEFDGCNRLLITTWGHDPSEILVSGALPMLLDALQHSPVLIQAYSNIHDLPPEIKMLPFPFHVEDYSMNEDIASIIANLREHVDMDHNCGYITIIKLKKKTHQPSSSNQKKDDKPPLSPFNSKVILENANLLEEELASLDLQDSSSQPPPSKNLGLKLDLKKGPKDEEMQWTLLDINFGIPLFDTTLNQTVCQRIIQKGLWKPESLKFISDGNSALGSKLLDFISECQIQNYTVPGLSKITEEVAMPTQQIFFDGYTFCQSNF